MNFNPDALSQCLISAGMAVSLTAAAMLAIQAFLEQKGYKY